MGVATFYIHFCIYTVDSQYPVTFPGHEASLGNMEGQAQCFHRVQRPSEHILAEKMQSPALL